MDAGSGLVRVLEVTTNGIISDECLNSINCVPSTVKCRVIYHLNYRDRVGGVGEREVTYSGESGKARFTVQHVTLSVVSNDVILDFRAGFAGEFQHDSSTFILFEFLEGRHIVDVWISGDQFCVVDHSPNGFFTNGNHGNTVSSVGKVESFPLLFIGNMWIVEIQLIEIV